MCTYFLFALLNRCYFVVSWSTLLGCGPSYCKVVQVVMMRFKFLWCGWSFYDVVQWIVKWCTLWWCNPRDSAVVQFVVNWSLVLVTRSNLWWCVVLFLMVSRCNNLSTSINVTRQISRFFCSERYTSVSFRPDLQRLLCVSALINTWHDGQTPQIEL